MREDYGSLLPVSTHSRLKAAGKDLGYGDIEIIVSTHSRLKAAGITHKHKPL